MCVCVCVCMCLCVFVSERVYVYACLCERLNICVCVRACLHMLHAEFSLFSVLCILLMRCLLHVWILCSTPTRTCWQKHLLLLSVPLLDSL